MNQHYLQLYADFIVKVGVNVRPRQNFIVRCPVTMPDFAHACVRAGYEAGAKTVVVRWEDGTRETVTGGDVSVRGLFGYLD